MNMMNLHLRQQSNRGLSDNGGIYSLQVELVDSRTETEQEKFLLDVSGQSNSVISSLTKS